MPKGRRVTEFTLGGLALLIAFSIGGYILGFGLGQQAGEQQANANTYARHAQDEINSACTGLDGVAQTECIIRVIEATNEHQRSEQDLNAQRNMARWALWMLVATMMMALITALGVYYVWRTLLATQKMAEDTRDIGEAQVRAYLSMNDGEVIIGEILEDNELGHQVRFDVWLTVHNSGQSPAMGVQVKIPKWRETHTIRDVVAGEKRRFDFGVYSHIGDVKFVNGSDTQVAFGIDVAVSYIDVFGKPFSEEKYFVGWLDLVEGESSKLYISEVQHITVTAKFHKLNEAEK
ncbi:hypothetical protein [Marivita sp.]|uniref:hypothetical protein n=1 Tax=Marivita sp. TaxID=2003365 RepID=UPI00262FBEA9|nr:hypothetical protein [Marivita sp.]